MHHSVEKAARLAGFPHSNVREIPTDDRLRMRLDALEESIARDRAGGLEPFMIVGSAGTTNTGAVDDLRGIAGVANHGAGLVFVLDTGRLREVTDPLAAAGKIGPGASALGLPPGSPS